MPFFSRLFRFVRHFADAPYYMPFCGQNKEYLSSQTLLSQLLTQLLKPEPRYYMPFCGQNKEYQSSQTLLSQLLAQLLKPEPLYYMPFRVQNKEYQSSQTLLSQLLTQLLKPEQYIICHSVFKIKNIKAVRHCLVSYLLSYSSQSSILYAIPCSK